jgi:hypothetical protein
MDSHFIEKIILDELAEFNIDYVWLRAEEMYLCYEEQIVKGGKR